MHIKYEIEPVFKIEFFKIKCINFKNKKEHLEEVLKMFPEMPFPNFYSNRNKADFTWQLQEIFKEEFSLIRTKYNTKIDVTRAWSVTYDKGHYHVPHNHSSQGYAAILYLQMKKGVEVLALPNMCITEYSVSLGADSVQEETIVFYGNVTPIIGTLMDDTETSEANF